MNRPAKPAAKKAAVKKAAVKREGEKVLALAIADAPKLSQAKAAKARVAEWLAEISRTAPGKALKALLASSPKVEALLAGLADGSPFLWDLASAEPARLLGVLEADPDKRFADLLSETAQAAGATKDEDEAMRLLGRIWL